MPKCAVCNQEYDHEYDDCPHCAKKRKRRTENILGWIGVIGFLLLCAYLTQCMSWT